MHTHIAREGRPGLSDLLALESVGGVAGRGEAGDADVLVDADDLAVLAAELGARGSAVSAMMKKMARTSAQNLSSGRSLGSVRRG